MFALQALSSPAPLSFPHAGTSSEVTHPGASPSSPSLPSEGQDEGGGSQVALVLLPEVLPLLPLDFCPAGGMEEPLNARSVHASSLLSHRFIRGLGRQELLSCGRLLLPFSIPVGSPSSSLHALRGGEAGSLPSPAPVRIPPWLPDLRLGNLGRCFGRMALVIGLVAHAVTPLSMLG